jgi:alkyl sulfatase BDS1-like metallo-beta-lactamase superfamily hydrolase
MERISYIHRLAAILAALLIYQVRGYDLSNITLVQGDTGWFNIVAP